MARESYYCDLLDFDDATVAKIDSFLAAARQALGSDQVVVRLDRNLAKLHAYQLYATAAEPPA